MLRINCLSKRTKVLFFIAIIMNNVVIKGGDYVLYHRIFCPTFSVSALRDNRNFWNPALLLCLCFFLICLLPIFFNEAGQKEVHMVFLLQGFFSCCLF